MNNQDSPLVSVIIPLYNAERYIAETIESVINQTYENWELIVVDDCSTDKSREIVRSFASKDNRIRLIESETNFGGPARPRNIGIDNSKGEYIAFLDADDLWLSMKLEDQLEYMIDNDLDFSSTNKIDFDKNGEKREKFIKRIQLNMLRDKVSIRILILFNIINTSSVMIKRKNNELAFDISKELIAVEDLFLWLTLLENNYRYSFLNKKLLKYRFIDSSISNHTDKRIVKLRHLCAVNKFILKYKKYDLYGLFILRVIIRIW